MVAERRIMRISQGAPIPKGWELVEWLGIETGILYGPNCKADVVLVVNVAEVPNARPVFKLLWAGCYGFGFVWRGVEHQFYRDIDGSMGKRWTHVRMPYRTEPLSRDNAMHPDFVTEDEG